MVGFKVLKWLQLIRGSSMEVTHLQYADDILIFCAAEEDQLRHLRVIFVLFEGMSGLPINRGITFYFPSIG